MWSTVGTGLILKLHVFPGKAIELLWTCILLVAGGVIQDIFGVHVDMLDF